MAELATYSSKFTSNSFGKFGIENSKPSNTPKADGYLERWQTCKSSTILASSDGQTAKEGGQSCLYPLILCFILTVESNISSNQKSAITVTSISRNIYSNKKKLSSTEAVNPSIREQRTTSSFCKTDVKRDITEVARENQESKQHNDQGHKLYSQWMQSLWQRLELRACGYDDEVSVR
ncbi:hypothetical protein KQX54_002001 [Cotesia glomerata]|uniref:Uncharacterized protein n=1 Tax=Cotesia glomerata TaxID=32391 RepID=A0AAV7IF65_COTGL|nr:hypothetical protein KQX54_002001 [Cotesia glomerata]